MERSLPPLDSYWRETYTERVVCVRDRFFVHDQSFVIFTTYFDDGRVENNGQMSVSYLFQKYYRMEEKELALFLLKKENNEETY